MPLRSTIVALLILATGVLAQVPQQPAVPAPFVTYKTAEKKDWTLVTEIVLRGAQPRVFHDRHIATPQPIVAEKLAMVFPLIPGSGYAAVYDEKIESELEIQGRAVDTEPRILEHYQAGTRLGAWEAENVDTRQLSLTVKLPMTTYETDINEERAAQVDWPKDPLPPMLVSALDAQLFVEPQHPAIRKLVDHWTNGKPRKLKPYVLAKYLAGRVAQHYEITEGIYEFDVRGPRRGSGIPLFSGVNVKGSVHAAVEREGSPLDYANLLTAVYRSVGIPARVLVTLDETTKTDIGLPAIHAMTEFYLYEEATGFGQWITVDILNLRLRGSSAYRLDRKWEYFGYHREIENYLPVSYHWHPPTAVWNAGPPALWGWITTPQMNFPDQQLVMHAYERPIRSGEVWELPPNKPE